jgi:hypothetical protein
MKALAALLAARIARALHACIHGMLNSYSLRLAFHHAVRTIRAAGHLALRPVRVKSLA